MKPQVVRTVFAVVCLLSAGACYSAAFRAADDYPNLRRLNVQAADVTLVFERPGRSFVILGGLEVRDVDDLREADFQEFVREEAARRGATGAWVLSSSARTAAHATFGEWFNPGGGIGIVRVLLFHFENEQ